MIECCSSILEKDSSVLFSKNLAAMVALSRCLGSLALFVAGAEGARISRKGDPAPSTKFIAGVPVLNYHTAYEGKGSLGELESEEEQEWVILVKPGTTDAQVQRMCKTNKNGCNLNGHMDGGVPFLELRGTERDLEVVLKSAEGAAKYVEPDAEVRMIPELEVNVEASTWGLTRIGADQCGSSGAGATVFVLDTGVRVSHQEFSGRARSALDMSSGSQVECSGDSSCAADAQGHGTHCAGSAAGLSFGVAPAAAVKAIKVLGDNGSGSWSWSYSALDWLATSPVRPAVASMSLGGSGTQQAMKDAVDVAVDAGVTVVVAGGNDNSNACGFSPAFVPSAITVGSTTSTDSRSSFSNYGACTNIWAPGSNVLSAGHTSDTESRSLSGTSMACPHVSGAVALLLEADPSKKSPALLEEMLDNAVWDALSGLKTGDTNALLYVAQGGGGGRPAPTPAPPPGTWVLYGQGCQMIDNCISSNNYPNGYGNNEECTVELFGDIPFVTESFTTESRYDKLTVGGVEYSGNSGPPKGSYSGSISWSSDFSVTKAGWKMCRESVTDDSVDIAQRICTESDDCREYFTNSCQCPSGDICAPSFQGWQVKYRCRKAPPTPAPAPPPPTQAPTPRPPLPTCQGGSWENCFSSSTCESD